MPSSRCPSASHLGVLLTALTITAACGDDDVVTASDASTAGSSGAADTTSGVTTGTPATEPTTSSATDGTLSATGSSTEADSSSTAAPTTDNVTTGDTSTGSTGSTGSTTTGGTSTGSTGAGSSTGDPGCEGPDSDGDTVPDECDICLAGDDLLDGDGDTVPDACDICLAGDDLLDGDGDAAPDACDPCPTDNPDDSDGDGVCDGVDICDKGDDTIDVDQDGVPDACDPDVVAEVQGPLYDFDSAADGTLVLSRFAAGQVFVTCYNPDLSVRKAEFVVGQYDLKPAPGPGPTVNIARDAQKVIVTWHDPNGPNLKPRMKYSYLDSGCDVLVPEAVAIEGVGVMEYHDTAIDAVGNAVIGVSREYTQIAFINSAGAVTSTQTAFTVPGTTYGTHVAMNQSTGEGVLTAQPHSGGTLHYRRFNADGTWKDPKVVAVPINNHYWYDGHTVGMNDKGQFVLLWRSSGTQLDFRVFNSDGSVLASVQRPTPNFENGTPYDSFRRRHSEVALRGDNFVFGEVYLSKPADLDVMHFEYTPAGALVAEDSTDISVAMVLAIRVTPGGRTYLHNGNKVGLLSDYP
jgi:hypothetical protein